MGILNALQTHIFIWTMVLDVEKSFSYLKDATMRIRGSILNHRDGEVHYKTKQKLAQNR